MSNIVLDIDTKIEQYIPIEKKQINIYELFNIFGIDLDFLIKEKQYSNNFFDNLEKGNYVISDKF